jgi:hypothetical protein
MTEEARKLLVVTSPAGRTIAISELPDSGRFVADDLAESRRLGDLNGDQTPFVVTIQDAPFIVFAGTVLSPGSRPRRDHVAGPHGHPPNLPRPQTGSG